ncbi:hypothetical protein WME79_40520 [Sorangium sp. So ce726]|uniref:hypothetical protein n=1 Tax=Sorangium sp. So ce726 TaxID=3133319 RepID=UPI003F63F918
MFVECAIFAFSLTLVISCLWRLADQPSEGEKILRRLRASPQTRVGDVAEQETARLTGNVRSAGEGLRAPLSGRSCVYYKITLEKLLGGAGWHEILCEQKAVDFLLDDGTGRAHVRSASMKTAVPADREQGSSWFRDGDEELEAFLRERGDPSKEWRYERVLRCREHLIAPGDRVTVLGAVSWEQDPEPSSAGRGYRDAPKRVVLSALPEGSLMASDRSDLVHDA